MYSGNSARFDELLQEIRLIHARHSGAKVEPRLEERLQMETASIMLRFEAALQVRGSGGVGLRVCMYVSLYDRLPVDQTMRRRWIVARNSATGTSPTR